MVCVPARAICLMPDSLLPLKVSGLSYSIKRKPLLSNLDLVIDSPGISVVLGPNGAGKSLLVRLLHGLLKPDYGQIIWNGRMLDLSIRKQQAMVFQKPVLLRRSVEANIKFVLKNHALTDRHNCEDILQQAGLLSQRHQPARLLSGGEQQRLALARALATSPQVLFLDEPTASIDPGSTYRIENLLMETRDSGVKLILVTHDIGQARRLASDVFFMHWGRILEHSDAQSFFEQPSTAEASAFLQGDLII